jgi:tetratricopeptide (TPR) repeat protein
MKIDPTLTKALRLARQKKFNQAMKVLEYEEKRFQDSFAFNYIFGLCCLHTRDFGNAVEYFRQARDKRPKEPLILLGMAALYLNRGDTDRAVNFYLEIQELDANNRLAKKALKIIRDCGAKDTLSEWLDSDQIYKLFPPFPTPPFTIASVLIPAFCLIAVLLVGGGILVKQNRLSLPFFRLAARDGYSGSMLAMEELNNPVQIDGFFLYTLTPEDILARYKEGQNYFAEHRDEKAKAVFNEILESNAADSIKNKSRILISYMNEPGFDTFKRDDNFSYSEVINDPVKYRNVYVIWRGMAANVKSFDNFTAFDLMVGYDTRKTVEGFLAVEFNFAIQVNPEQPLEVLGRVVPTTDTRKIRLEGLALHQAGFLRAGQGAR